MKKILFLSTLLLLTSCKSKLETTLIKLGINDNSVKVTKVEHPKKDILFIEMIHLGQKEFYNDVKQKVDSLSNLGYHFFYEGLYLRRSDRQINDTLSYKKYRKVFGLDPTYSFTQRPAFSKVIKKYNLINQPDNIKLGLNRSNSNPVDISLVNQIKVFETHKGEIKLDKCDYKTRLGSKYYACKTLPKKYREFYRSDITRKMRDRNIYQSIENSGFDKIAIIYGKRHLKGLLELYENE